MKKIYQSGFLLSLLSMLFSLGCIAQSEIKSTLGMANSGRESFSNVYFSQSAVFATKYNRLGIMPSLFFSHGSQQSSLTRLQGGESNLHRPWEENSATSVVDLGETENTLTWGGVALMLSYKVVQKEKLSFSISAGPALSYFNHFYLTGRETYTIYNDLNSPRTYTIYNSANERFIDLGVATAISAGFTVSTKVRLGIDVGLNTYFKSGETNLIYGPSISFLL